jgi:prepilin-type N-terminal cleavage/methylation domain-containing protein
MIRSLQQSRRGFTLVEVLVVISILAIIAAIGAGAYFAIMGSQKNDASRSAVAKIDGLLLRKMKAIRDKIKDDVRNNRPGTGYSELKTAGLTSEAAEAVLLYCRMKNELPMTYAEALTATGIPFTTIALPVRSEFKGLSGSPGIHVESAVCLYRALATMGLEGLEQQQDASLAGTEKYFKDNGGKPIIFNRLAYGGDQNELNSAPYSKVPPFDPFFPKKLPNGTYQDLSAELGAVNTATFWNAVTPPLVAVKTYWGIPFTYPVRTFHTACAISFGQQDQSVIDPGMYPAMYGNGNIVSYRLREEGAKGD